MPLIVQTKTPETYSSHRPHVKQLSDESKICVHLQVKNHLHEPMHPEHLKEAKHIFIIKISFELHNTTVGRPEVCISTVAEGLKDIIRC